MLPRSSNLSLLLAAGAVLAGCLDPGPSGPDVGERPDVASVAQKSTEAAPSGLARVETPDPLFQEAIRSGRPDGLAYLPEGGPPGTPVAVGRIGPAGGSLALGAFEMVVPPGAVEEDVLFMIRLPRDEASRAWVVAELRPHDVTFREPVTLRVTTAGTTAEGSEAEVLGWDGAEWVFGGGETADVGGAVELSVDHFSLWGLFLRGELTSGGR